MAEVIFNDLAEKHGLDARASSAGLASYPGLEASLNSILVLEEFGLDLRGHRSKQVTGEMLKNFDLVLTMSRSHKESIRYEFGEGVRVYTLLEYVWSINEDLADPFGQSYDVYASTRDQIYKSIEKLIEKLEEDYVETIGIGSDHGGFELKEEIRKYLIEEGYEVRDYGTDSTESVDYPEYGRKVAHAVVDGHIDRGIVICGTGIGISLAANKVKGIRCALCSDTYSARMSVAHNNANMLAMGGRVIGVDLAKEVVKAWLNEEFEGGRHERRVNKIEE